MKKAFLFLASGFEETEAIGTVDVLRRGSVEVTLVSLTGNKMVEGAHGIEVASDALFEEVDYKDADVLVLPGGMPGTNNLNAHEGLKTLLTRQYEAGKYVAAICAAPIVLGGLGLLKGKKATVYPGFEAQLTGAEVSSDAAVKDGNVITGHGPGLVYQFGLTILEALRGKEVAEETAAGLLL
ncbi:DJ-1 family glyoxalase III [Parabacteroides pacaensis]|uniref:DJ-1 family glyoxalase III n=1 Tax=Parabacteroides pacaensis TaxID=2086575 RepID=UPI000D0F31F3|nr:DJ-1 family glyoxalase III [Parabacteroides pacaensis]